MVGEALSERLGIPFLDGDRFHPAANVAKMSSGTPLTDEDRWPWLDAIAAAIRSQPGGVIVACSALRRVYRERLSANAGRHLIFVLLDGSQETLAKRLVTRRGHFMPASLLASQLATLERPGGEERAVTVSVEAELATVVAEVADRLAIFAATRSLSAG